MPENEKELCPTCENGLRCTTWAEWKCLKHKKRVYKLSERTECKYYKKRSKGAEEPQCHCEDCLREGQEEGC